MGALLTCRGVESTTAALERDLRAAGYSLGPATPATTTVLDTFDGRLARRRPAPRPRRARSSCSTTAPGATPARSSRTVPRFVGDLDRGPFRSRLADIVEMRALLPLATVTTVARRAERRNDDGKVTSVVTIHDDARPPTAVSSPGGSSRSRS